jgi:hypothetical protein
MPRDWFDVTGNPRDDRPVHLGRRCERTDRIGGWSTPDRDTRTACGGTWAEDLPIAPDYLARSIAAGKAFPDSRMRRHVTLTRDLVTCEACRAWAAAHPEVFDRDGIYSRTLDGGKPFPWERD